MCFKYRPIASYFKKNNQKLAHFISLGTKFCKSFRKTHSSSLEKVIKRYKLPVMKQVSHMDEKDSIGNTVNIVIHDRR